MVSGGIAAATAAAIAIDREDTIVRERENELIEGGGMIDAKKDTVRLATRLFERLGRFRHGSRMWVDHGMIVSREDGLMMAGDVLLDEDRWTDDSG